MSIEALRVVVRYRRATAYGLHAVLGALDHDRPAGSWSVAIARDEAACAAAIEEGLAGADRVLVAWSFFSADLPVVAGELTRLRAGGAGAGHGPGRVLHLAGGVHASAEPARTLAAGFDLVAVGEGEGTFVGLVGALAAGDDHRAVPGLRWDGGDAVPASSGPAPREPLDRWPPFAPRWGLYNPLEVTRGCVYACRFCQTPSMFKARFRHRSIAGMAAHVGHMRSAGMRYVRFVTPTALSYGSDSGEPDLGAVEGLLATVRSIMGPDARVYFGSFPSEVRPEHVTPEAVALLRRYVDNDNLVIGAQSGSDAVLAAANRGHTVADVERAVRVAAAGGFRPDVDVLFGMPGETEADARATVALMERLSSLGARIHAHTFMPLPGTPWRDAPPGAVPGPVQAGLDRLVGRGMAHGQWAAQQERAVRLSPLVRHRPRPPAGPPAYDS